MRSWKESGEDRRGWREQIGQKDRAVRAWGGDGEPLRFSAAKGHEATGPFMFLEGRPAAAV